MSSTRVLRVFIGVVAVAIFLPVLGLVAFVLDENVLRIRYSFEQKREKAKIKLLEPIYRESINSLRVRAKLAADATASLKGQASGSRGSG